MSHPEAVPLLKRLDERFPALSRWLGGRLDLELPAFTVSVVLHATLLTILGIMTIEASREAPREFAAVDTSGDTRLPEFARNEIEDIDQANKELTLTPIGSSAPNLSALPVQASGPLAPPTSNKAEGGGAMPIANLAVTRPGEIMLPSAPSLSQSVSIRGNGAEHVGGVEGAVDRIAVEMLRRLEQGRTLVVWAFDASGSLQAERERLGRHIEKIYRDIAELDKEGLAKDDALLTSVVAFGQGRQVLTPTPTSDPSTIMEAIGRVPLDATGEESTFGTVAEVVRKFGRYKDKKHTYQTMVIVVTDEVGDDEGRLEEAIQTAVQARVPVYVLGSPAVFGRLEGRMNYTDPKTKQTFYNLPVRQGPESVALEQIRLPFWYDGPQHDLLDAGFGPYALTRLANATGGIYFITRLGPSRLTFDPNLMREYRPDWGSRMQYEKAVEKSPLRRAVYQSALLTQQNLPGQPSLVFPPADGPEFKEAMARNQEIVARVEYTVSEALGPITEVVKLRDRETSRRWQAHYDLARGRLLAMKVRCYEYNAICARMKKDALKFQNPRSNAWRLVPTDQVASGDKVAAVAAEAKALLQKVVADHPNTPWALLAQRELKDAFGFRWQETYVPPPPPRREETAEAARKKAQNKQQMPRPAEPPKL